MTIVARALASVLALLSLASGAAAQVAPHIVTPADADGQVSPFYKWTGRIPAKAGTLLRSEPLPRTMALPGAGVAERILYTSTDGIGGKTPVVVSGALFIPEGPAPKGGWPVIAWGHGTVGVADVCAPSWAGRSWRDVRYLSEWLRQGFAIVATDYQGLGTPGPHPYLATRPEGYSMLDSARAVVRGKRGLSNRIVLVGQSQGGGAAIAAAGLAPAYAPDLGIIGTVATGAGVIPRNTQRPTSGSSPEIDATSAYGLYLAMALAAIDPAFKLDQAVSPQALPVLNQGANRCIDAFEFDVLMAGLNWSNAFTDAGIRAFARSNAMVNAPVDSIPTPLFMGTGALDIDVDPRRQKALADGLCAAGTRVEHHIYPGDDHSAAVNRSLKDSVPFVRRLLVGETVTGNCGATS